MNEIISEREARWPFCLVCNKPVDGYDVDFNVELVKGRFGCHDGQYVAGRYTTYRIRCHGEHITMDYDNVTKRWVNPRGSINLKIGVR